MKGSVSHFSLFFFYLPSISPYIIFHNVFKVGQTRYFNTMGTKCFIEANSAAERCVAKPHFVQASSME